MSLAAALQLRYNRFWRFSGENTMTKQYFQVLDNSDGGRPTEVSEASFGQIRDTVDRFDLFLWVDGPDAICGRRDRRALGMDGPVLRAATKLCPGRESGDLELRAASARLLAAIVRHGDWIAPTTAFRLGNPQAAVPSERNAFVTFSKGRQRLDFERGDGVWEAFDQVRRHHGAAEALVRFRPGLAPVQRLGLPEILLRWCVAWSVDNSGVGQRPAIVGDLPVWASARAPQLVHVAGLEFIIRDAIVRPARDEAVLLVDVSDPSEKGPFCIEGIGLVTGAGDQRTRWLQESVHPEARMAVPGRTVVRLRTRRQGIDRDAVIKWACVAIRWPQRSGAPGVDSVELEVVIRLSSAAEPAVERCLPVQFRVVPD